MNKTNVDPQEIAKFSDQAAHWWDPEGQFKTLHEINPLRVEFITRNVSLANKRVVDIGCGGGILTESMSKLGAIVTGIDMSEPALNTAKLRQLETQTTIDYSLTTAEELASQREGYYDVVTCLEMLEHVPNPHSVIEACATLVKPGGNVFFSTLNRNIKSYFFAIIGAEYLLKLLPQHTHDFSKFICPSELAEWTRQAGLTTKEMVGITYNVFNKKYSLNQDISVNYLVHLIK